MDAGGTSHSVQRTALETDARAVEEDPELASHPGPRQYVMIAIWLAIATAIEVAWYYLDVPHAIFVTLLLVLAFVKFSLVVLWFMHLRFDSPIFRTLFVTGIILAITVYVVVLVIFGALNAPWLLVAVGLIAAAVVATFLRSARSPVRRGAGMAGPGDSGH
jgi:cytochrome c oxidase subunit 4